MSKEENETLKNKVYQALGTASMCWSETPKGIFDDTNAVKVGDALWEAIEKEIKEVAIGLLQWVEENNEGTLRIITKDGVSPDDYEEAYQLYLNGI